jgi:hypothetical protein
VIEDHNECWNNHDCVDQADASNNCHNADDEGEVALGERLQAQYETCVNGTAEASEPQMQAPCKNEFQTLVVTHDRASMDPDADYQRNGFLCTRNDAGGCSCKCNQHAACCSRMNKLLANTDIQGNKFDDVQSLQACCDLCTNHPECTAWEYDSEQVCVLKHGEPEMVDNTAADVLTTWAGTPSGDTC